jgi:hypothetical protein
MSAAAIIRDAQADGVRLALSASGSIKASGDGAVVNRWLPAIRQHRDEIIEALRCAANDATMSDQDERRILAWLDHIGETDPPTIGEVVDRCRSDPEARRYFLERAEEIDAAIPDDRRTCRQCSNLRGGVCSIARPGGTVSAIRGYRPLADLLQRCAGFEERTANPVRHENKEVKNPAPDS